MKFQTCLTKCLLCLQVQRIILHQDENGQLRVVDMATEEQVKRMLEARGLSQSTAGETMVVHVSTKRLVSLSQIVIKVEITTC